MPNEWLYAEIEQLKRGIEFMECGAVNAPCDVVPGQTLAEREAAEAKANTAKITEDRRTIAELEAILTKA